MQYMSTPNDKLRYDYQKQKSNLSNTVNVSYINKFIDQYTDGKLKKDTEQTKTRIERGNDGIPSIDL